jgi:hypothetical protein
VSGVLWALASAAGFAAPPDSPPAPVQTIVVEGQKLNVETRIDRKIYSVPDDAQSTLGTLSDILSVIPSIDVDPDGVVSLRGDTNVLILIDGKPATQLQGANAGDNLQSISARDIERIEVLTTPPAQFKAEGAAGVINIITRKRRGKESESGCPAGQPRQRRALADRGQRQLRRQGVHVIGECGLSGGLPRPDDSIAGDRRRPDDRTGAGEPGLSQAADSPQRTDCRAVERVRPERASVAVCFAKLAQARGAAHLQSD